MMQRASASIATIASITRDGALALVVAAREAAKGMGIEVAIAVTDAGGNLTAFERADGAPFLTVGLAIDKAWTAASYGHSTRIWNHIVSQAETAPLAQHPRLMAVGGGVPILAAGRVVGGLGISGGTAQEDHEVAVAALGGQGFEAPK